MRLGDLDALKKELRREVSGNKVGVFFAKRVFDIIDNAPTVEPCYQTTSCLDCKNYDKANYYCPRFCEVIRETTKEIKRQGEWIDHSEKDGYVECPFCQHLTTCEGNIDELHYCWNCGAEMRKPNCVTCDHFGNCEECEKEEEE